MTTASPESCSTKAADATMFQFEQWARNAVPQFSAAGKHVRDGRWSYNHNIVEIMWQCWRAALEVADTPTDRTKAMRDTPTEANDMRNTLRTVEFRLALSRITERYPPDTVAGRLAADALAKYPNQFENADRENDCEPFPIPEIEGLLLGGEYTAMQAARSETPVQDDDAEKRLAELRHWFFQKLNPEQRTAFLFATGIAPKTCEFTLGMQHKAIELIANRLGKQSLDR